jgi:hypothetical protein
MLTDGRTQKTLGSVEVRLGRERCDSSGAHVMPKGVGAINYGHRNYFALTDAG